MAHYSPAKTSHALNASYPSASAHSQLPLQTGDSFQRTDLKQPPVQNNKDRSVEYPTSTTHSSLDKRQQDKPHQHSIAEQGMNNPAMAYPRTQEQQISSSHTQLDIDLRKTEQQLEDLKRMKFDLREKEGQLKHLQIQYQTNLASKDQQIHSLHEQVQTLVTTNEQELKNLTDGCRANIIQKDRETDDIRQMWKQTAKELGKYQAQDKAVDQVTDPEVTQKARQIQYNVRNFAYQHFGGELNTGKSVQGSWQYLQSHLQMPTDVFEACMNSPVKRPMLVGALLWGFLVQDIFGNFWWAGTRVHHGMDHLMDMLSERSHVASSLYDPNKFDQSPPETRSWPTGPRQNADIRCGKPTLAPSWWMR